MFKTSQAVSKPEKVMSTRTFAKKSGRQHGNVLTMLRNMVEKGELELQESYYTIGNGLRQYAEFKLALGDFEKIAHRLNEKDMKTVRKYFGVPAYTVEKVVTGFGDHTIAVRGFVEEVKPAPPVQLTLLATAGSPQGGGLTMSSREIAKLTGATHANTLSTVRSLIEKGVIFGNETPYTHSQNGQTYREYQLSYRDTLVVASGYSVELRAKVIDRWQELETQVSQPQFKVPTTLLGALQLAAELEGQRTALTHQVEVQVQKIAEDAPKVEVYHKIADSRGLIGFQKFCTHLNLNQKEIKHWMKDIGWLRADQYMVNPLPTAKAVDNGYCRITGFTTEHGKFTQQIWFTGKALTYVTEKVPSYVRKKVAGTRSKAA